jgi:hypothetical protein
LRGALLRVCIIASEFPDLIHISELYYTRLQFNALSNPRLFLRDFLFLCIAYGGLDVKLKTLFCFASPPSHTDSNDSKVHDVVERRSLSECASERGKRKNLQKRYFKRNKKQKLEGKGPETVPL